MMPLIWINISSGNGLLPDGTKPLPEPMLTYDQRCFVAFPLRVMSLEVLVNLICNMCPEIALIKLLSYLPEANESVIQNNPT